MPSPKLNLIVLRATNIEHLANFYSKLGLHFTRHRHGKGPEHYGSESSGIIFEIYPKRNESDSTHNLRLGFQVPNLQNTLDALQKFQINIVSPPKTSEWGIRAVIDDPEGHRIELIEAQKQTP